MSQDKDYLWYPKIIFELLEKLLWYEFFSKIIKFIKLIIYQKEIDRIFLYNNGKVKSLGNILTSITNIDYKENQSYANSTNFMWNGYAITDTTLLTTIGYNYTQNSGAIYNVEKYPYPRIKPTHLAVPPDYPNQVLSISFESCKIPSTGKYTIKSIINNFQLNLAFQLSIENHRKLYKGCAPTSNPTVSVSCFLATTVSKKKYGYQNTTEPESIEVEWPQGSARVPDEDFYRLAQYHDGCQVDRDHNSILATTGASGMWEEVNNRFNPNVDCLDKSIVFNKSINELLLDKINDLEIEILESNKYTINVSFDLILEFKQVSSNSGVTLDINYFKLQNQYLSQALINENFPLPTGIWHHGRNIHGNNISDNIHGNKSEDHCKWPSYYWQNPNFKFNDHLFYIDKIS